MSELDRITTLSKEVASSAVAYEAYRSVVLQLGALERAGRIRGESHLMAISVRAHTERLIREAWNDE